MLLRLASTKQNDYYGNIYKLYLSIFAKVFSILFAIPSFLYTFATRKDNINKTIDNEKRRFSIQLD